MEINTSVHFRHTAHVFPKIKSPFLSSWEDLCALCPVESVYGMHKSENIGYTIIGLIYNVLFYLSATWKISCEIKIDLSHPSYSRIKKKLHDQLEAKEFEQAVKLIRAANNAWPGEETFNFKPPV